MRKYILLVASLFLVGCQASEEDSEKVSSMKEQEMTVLETYLSRNERYHSILLNYTLSKDGVVFSSGSSSRRVYFGKDENGFDTKVEQRIVYQKNYASLDENDDSSLVSKTMYYSSDMTYTKMEDGTFSEKPESHDIETYGLMYDLDKFRLEEESEDESEITLKGNVIDSKGFFKKDRDYQNVTCDIVFEKNSLSLTDMHINYDVESYQVKMDIEFGTFNDRILLP